MESVKRETLNVKFSNDTSCSERCSSSRSPLAAETCPLADNSLLMPTLHDTESVNSVNQMADNSVDKREASAGSVPKPGKLFGKLTNNISGFTLQTFIDNRHKGWAEKQKRAMPFPQRVIDLHNVLTFCRQGKTGFKKDELASTTINTMISLLSSASVLMSTSGRVGLQRNLPYVMDLFNDAVMFFNPKKEHCQVEDNLTKLVKQLLFHSSIDAMKLFFEKCFITENFDERHEKILSNILAMNKERLNDKLFNHLTVSFVRALEEKNNFSVRMSTRLTFFAKRRFCSPNRLLIRFYLFVLESLLVLKRRVEISPTILNTANAWAALSKEGKFGETAVEAEGTVHICHLVRYAAGADDIETLKYILENCVPRCIISLCANSPQKLLKLLSTLGNEVSARQTLESFWDFLSKNLFRLASNPDSESWLYFLINYQPPEKVTSESLDRISFSSLSRIAQVAKLENINPAHSQTVANALLSGLLSQLEKFLSYPNSAKIASHILVACRLRGSTELVNSVLINFWKWVLKEARNFEVWPLHLKNLVIQNIRYEKIILATDLIGDAAFPSSSRITHVLRDLMKRDNYFDEQFQGLPVDLQDLYKI